MNDFNFRNYIDKKNIKFIKVVSPHLDDAAFSLSSTLMIKNLPDIEIITIFTEPANSDENTIAYINYVEAYNERRNNDVMVMKRLGVKHTHMGIEEGNFSDINLEQITQSTLDGAKGEKLLLLVPIGAGKALSTITQFFRWIFRIPMGCPSHLEHELVRNLCLELLNSESIIVGFYAEIPYQWANSPYSLRKLLKKITRQNFQKSVYISDVDMKLSIIKMYKSEFISEFGKNADYQKRVASRPELIYLPS